MKKLLAMLLVLAMVFSMVACGSSSEEKNPTTAPVVEETKAPAQTEPVVDDTPKGDPVYINENAADMTGKVRFHTAFALEVGTGALIEEFNKYYPNIEVEAIVYKNTDEGNVALDAATKAGEVDVMLSFGVANTAARWKSGMWLDITDRLAADNLDMMTEWGTDTYTYNDRVYSFPSGAMSFYIAINEDMWKEAGLGEIPTEWTWDQYLDACRKMTKYNEDGSVAVYGGLDYWDKDAWVHRVRQVKGSNVYYNEDGMTDFDNELFQWAIQLEVDATEEGIWASKPYMVSTGLRNRQIFLGGMSATTVDCILTRHITAIEHDFKIAYAPYPVKELGQTNYMAGAIPNSHIGIAKNAQDLEAAYAFAKFCATYGNKYMYASGHAGSWVHNDASEILAVVFGSFEEAQKYLDVESFQECVVAAGKTAYSEDYIVGYTPVHNMLLEYTDYVLSGELTAAEMMEDLKEFGDEEVEAAK